MAKMTYDIFDSAWGNLDDDVKFNLFQSACGWGTIDGYDELFNMDEFDEIMNDRDPTDIAERVYYGDFNPSDEYFGFDGDGNLTSYSVYGVYDYVDNYEGKIYDYLKESDDWGEFPKLIEEIEKVNDRVKFDDDDDDDDEDKEEEDDDNNK